MKIKFANIIMIFFLTILVQANAHAFQATNDQTVDANKVWTLTFTDEVGFDDITKSGIVVTDSKGKPAAVDIKQGNNSKSIIVNAPQGGYTPGESYTLTINTKAHSNKGKSLKQERAIRFNIKDSSQGAVQTKLKDNTIKVYYVDDDLKVDLQFDRAVDELNAKDFRLGGITPSTATHSGSKVTLTFKDGDPATSDDSIIPVTYANGLTNNNPTKIELIKAQGQNAKLTINATGTTDETGALVSTYDNGTSAVLSKEQASIYSYQAAPRTTCWDDTAADFWTATKSVTGAKVYITFDTPLDINSGIKTDDFIFTSSNGTNIEADSVTISGNTVIFTFEPTNKDYSAFTGNLSVIAKSTASIRTLKDVDGEYAKYIPSTDDKKRRLITITGQ